MSKQTTIQEQAASREHWEEYIDPDNNAPFGDYSQEEREEMIREIWPDTPEENDK